MYPYHVHRKSMNFNENSSSFEIITQRAFWKQNPKKIQGFEPFCLFRILFHELLKYMAYANTKENMPKINFRQLAKISGPEVNLADGVKFWQAVGFFLAYFPLYWHMPYIASRISPSY